MCVGVCQARHNYEAVQCLIGADVCPLVRAPAILCWPSSLGVTATLMDAMLEHDSEMTAAYLSSGFCSWLSFNRCLLHCLLSYRVVLDGFSSQVTGLLSSKSAFCLFVGTCVPFFISQTFLK